MTSLITTHDETELKSEFKALAYEYSLIKIDDIPLLDFADFESRITTLIDKFTTHIIEKRRYYDSKISWYVSYLGRVSLLGGFAAFFYEIVTGQSPIVWVGGCLCAIGLYVEVSMFRVALFKRQAIEDDRKMEDALRGMRADVKWFLRRSNTLALNVRAM